MKNNKKPKIFSRRKYLNLKKQYEKELRQYVRDEVVKDIIKSNTK